jgi:two-component sensor histidine kinase/streptogramin lyase
MGSDGCGLLRYDPRSQEWINFKHDPKWDGSILPGAVHAIFEDRDHNMWIGTSNGISILSTRRQFFSNFNRTTGPNGLSLDRTRRLLVVGDELWLWKEATGLLRLSSRFELLDPALTVPKAKPGFETYVVPRLIDERHIYSVVWYSGLFRTDRVTGETVRYTDYLGEAASDMRDIFVDSKQRYWAWQWGRFGRLDPEKKTFETVEVPAEIWRGRPGLVNSISEDDSGRFWIGTQGSGLLCFDPGQMKFVDQLGPQTHTVPAVTITRTLIRGDTLYLGMEKLGLGLLDLNTNDLTVFSRKDGLCSNNITDMLFDADGDLWIGSGSGLSWFDKYQRLRTFTADDGLLSNNVSQMGLLADGRIVVNVGQGLVTFNPRDLKRSSPLIRPAVASLHVYDEAINLFSWAQDSPTIRIPWTRNYFRAEFSALEFLDPDRIRFAYMLDGADPDWNYTDHRPVATYTNLPGGHYELLVRCTNVDGVWGPVMRIPLVVTTPFFRQLWFYALIVAILATTLYYLYRLRIRRLKAVYALRNRISRDLHDDIGSGLSGIRMLSAALKKGGGRLNPEEAAGKIEETSQEIMDKMSDIVWVISPRHDTTEELIARMRLTATELLDAKGIELTFTEQSESRTRLPIELRRNVFLIMKEAVNNMCKYSDARHATITIHQGGNRFEMTIADDGKGFDVEHVTYGNGLSNMRERAREIGGRIDITSSLGAGTNIRLVVDR